MKKTIDCLTDREICTFLDGFAKNEDQIKNHFTTCVSCSDKVTEKKNSHKKYLEGFSLLAEKARDQKEKELKEWKKQPISEIITDHKYLDTMRNIGTKILFHYDNVTDIEFHEFKRYLNEKYSSPESKTALDNLKQKLPYSCLLYFVSKNHVSDKADHPLINDRSE